MNNINNSEICFLIPSYNRFNKLKNLLNQISESEGVGVIIYNDASNEDGYYSLGDTYENYKILHGTSNNGRNKFNETIKLLFREASLSNYNYFILIADDMVLCDNFIENVSPFLNQYDIVNIFSLSSSAWRCSAYIDGAFTISKSGINFMYNLIPKISRDSYGKSTGVWQTVTGIFCGKNTESYRLACLNYSLIQHDGNEDSKLHPKFREKIPIVAQNYYNDFYGNKIEIISKSEYGKIGNNKKKSSDGTSNGNAVEVKKPEPPKTIVINNKKAILPNAEKLHKPNNPISKIGDDALLAKIRRRNTGFGGRR
jgi:hypothetical protein